MTISHLSVRSVRSVDSIRSVLPRSTLAVAWAALATSALSTSGCATDDLPTTQLGNTSDLLVEASEPVAPRLPIATEEGVDPFLFGDWVGRAEDLFGPSNADGSRPTYTFPSGSSEIYLHLDPTLGRELPSNIRFGQREAPVPEQGVAYGTANYHVAEGFRIAGSPSFPPVEGVAYSLSPAALLVRDGDPGIELVYYQGDGFADWCPLQRSLPTESGFKCEGLTGWGGGDIGDPCYGTLADGTGQEMDCNFATLCGGVSCNCDESGCNATYNNPVNELWLAREGDQLLGYLSRAVFQHGDRLFLPIGTVHFERAQP